MVDEYRRLQGGVMWVDFGRRSYRTREPADVKAILRPDELRMQLVVDGAEYEVALRKGPDGLFQGTWERGRPGAVEERGTAECRLVLDDSTPGAMNLDGKWLETIDWAWYGRLEDTHTSSASGES